LPAQYHAGGLRWCCELVDLAAVAREVESRLLPQARAGEVEIRVQAEGDAGAVADRDRAVQVVSNLVENAVRATPAGGAVTIAAEPGRIRVSDTGPGIPAEELPHAFEP
jgi:two-component system, OmpR family, sensor histidine kinase BaeS